MSENFSKNDFIDDNPSDAFIVLIARLQNSGTVTNYLHVLAIILTPHKTKIRNILKNKIILCS